MMIVDIEAFLAVLTQRSNDRPLTNRIHESVRLRLRSEELDMNIDLPRDPSFASAREQLSGKLQPNGINAMTAESPLDISDREKRAHVYRLLQEIPGLTIHDISASTPSKGHARAHDPFESPISARVLDEREYPMLLLIGDETDRGYDRHKICSSNIQS